MAVNTGPAEDEVMSTINIPPFTDVLLVLLIIFIILASVTKEPKLPDAKNVLKVQPSEIVVLVDKDNKVQVGSQIVDQTDAGRVFLYYHHAQQRQECRPSNSRRRRRRIKFGCRPRHKLFRVII